MDERMDLIDCGTWIFSNYQTQTVKRLLPRILMHFILEIRQIKVFAVNFIIRSGFAWNLLRSLELDDI